MNRYKIKILKHHIYRYDMFLKNGMADGADLEAQHIIKLINSFNNNDISLKMQEVINFLAYHSKFVGKEQAIKDLQRGISLLNKNRRKSPIDAKNVLKEDSVFLNKTYEALCDVCKNYSANIIKKHIKKGILNNVIFDTKNNNKIDSKMLLDGIMINLGGY